MSNFMLIGDDYNEPVLQQQKSYGYGKVIKSLVALKKHCSDLNGAFYVGEELFRAPNIHTMFPQVLELCIKKEMVRLAIEVGKSGNN